MQLTNQSKFVFIKFLFACLIVFPNLAVAQETVDRQKNGNQKSNRFPNVEIVNTFGPKGESNVRSSIKLAKGIALIGTEETGDVYKTIDAGQTWAKTTDGGDAWKIQDVRNFIRANDNRIYATTSEPALVLRSDNEGKTWEVVARPKASRTVALVQLDTGDILVGLRRSENDKISIIRSADHFKTYDTIVLDDKLPRQNTTCLFDMGKGVVLCGVGYEASGKIFRSTDAGLTWTMTAEFPEARDVMNFFKIEDQVFVLTSGIATIFASGDAGKSWAKHAQIWKKGFVGQYAALKHNDQTFHLLAATDQRKEQKRHIVLISDDAGKSWHEWIELASDKSGGASNIAVIDDGTVVVGTGNHSVQGYVYTLKVK
jgi:photosystem II stability/assembly factor-like uncharacterized protein